jgi:DNA-binding transcriptional LysR family regulator
MDLNEAAVFTKVVQIGSFSGAANALGMPKSTVSRKIAELEERLGARLLQRTTRRLSLTDAGNAFHRHALRAVQELERAAAAVHDLQDTPRGLLRVTAPLNVPYLGPVLSSFLVDNPAIQIEMLCSDRVMNLVEDGIDVAIRAGELKDSTLVARSLGTMNNYIVASPAFIAAHGQPAVPADLANFDCIVFSAGSDRARWRLLQGNASVSVDVRGRYVVNDFDLVHAAVSAGVGIGLLPSFRCREDIAAGRLERLLGDCCSPETPMHAVYPSTRHLSPKVIAFVAHVKRELALTH